MIEAILAFEPPNLNNQRIDDLVQYFNHPQPIYDPAFCLDDLDLKDSETGENILHILVKLNNFEAVERFITKLKEIQIDNNLRSKYISSINNNIDAFKIAIKGSENQENDDTAKINSLKIFELFLKESNFAQGLVSLAIDKDRTDILEFLEGFKHNTDYEYDIHRGHGLVKSCKDGNIKMLKFFLSNQISRYDNCSEDEDGIHPYEYIAKNKQMIDNLYDEDPNTANRLLNSFFKLVAQSDDAYYQVDGVSNNMVCQGNKPFLHCIVEYKNDKLLKFILDKNHDRSQTFIDIEQENRTRAYGMRSNIDQIIEEDPNFGYLRSPNEVDPRNNKSTLHLAIETQQIEMVRILIENDVDVDLQDNQQKTAMHYIAEGLLANPKSEFYREALILVVISGPAINIYDNNTETPIDIIEKIPDSDIYEIKSIIDIATRDRELAILLDEFVDEINSNENLENRQILLRELENALKRNEESNFELDQSDSLINKISSLIKDGADPYTKNKDNVNCFEVIDMVEDENIKSDLLKLFNNSMFAGKLIATMGYSGGDLMMKGEKSEILKSVESRIKVQSIISAGFDDFCRNFLKIKDSPGESPSALTSPSNGSLDAGSMALSSGQGAEVPIKKQRL